MDAESAKRVAEVYIAQNMARDDVEYVVYDRPEKDQEGWYFSYQSRKFVETNDLDHSLVGNWPVLVTREGVCLGARLPPSYRALGVPSAKAEGAG